MKKEEKTEIAGTLRAVRWLIWIIVITIVAPLLFVCAAYIIGSAQLNG